MIIFGLFGKTGCGKTEILNELKKKYSVVDIEGCANNKGSILGDLYDLSSNTQEEFDACLEKQRKIAENTGYCIVEFEGRRIGGRTKVTIPEPFSDLKCYEHNIVVNCPYECQIKRLLNWYLPKNEVEKEILIDKFIDLKSALSKPEKIELMDEIVDLLKKDEYNDAAILIEEGLYSEHYLRHIGKVKHDLIINNEDILKSTEEISKYIDEILKKHGIKI
ncbi:ATP/GTP-binding site motif A (P-loop) [Methanococcus maripaludis C5]|uniref:ATP/GTP-binding site motif A (P-loop) n=1 Tax=Methanococcus maripaludis (strain C5 / ATCC BAA-1333) TaxID=402880 RepID=A4FXT2_METM5|nr:selenouridine synthase SelU-like subunit [Methanococcus maripaludis]ABO35016.1 ATP/GTP-binding site motif A (P-loop) [Methanococcus maripaludis C5]